MKIKPWKDIKNNSKLQKRLEARRRKIEEKQKKKLEQAQRLFKEILKDNLRL